MAVTRSTVVGRQRARIRRTSGWREMAALLAASLTIAVGLFLVYKAKTAAFNETDQALKEKRLLNLNEASNVEQLLPFLRLYSNDADRRFAAEKIYAYLQGAAPSSRRALANLGELARIRVT